MINRHRAATQVPLLNNFDHARSNRMNRRARCPALIHARMKITRGFPIVPARGAKGRSHATSQRRVKRLFPIAFARNRFAKFAHRGLFPRRRLQSRDRRSNHNILAPIIAVFNRNFGGMQHRSASIEKLQLIFPRLLQSGNRHKAQCRPIGLRKKSNRTAQEVGGSSLIAGDLNHRALGRLFGRGVKHLCPRAQSAKDRQPTHLSSLAVQLSRAPYQYWIIPNRRFFQGAFSYNLNCKKYSRKVHAGLADVCLVDPAKWKLPQKFPKRPRRPSPQPK